MHVSSPVQAHWCLAVPTVPVIRLYVLCRACNRAAGLAGQKRSLLPIHMHGSWSSSIRPPALSGCCLNRFIRFEPRSLAFIRSDPATGLLLRQSPLPPSLSESNQTESGFLCRFTHLPQLRLNLLALPSVEQRASSLFAFALALAPACICDPLDPTRPIRPRIRLIKAPARRSIVHLRPSFRNEVRESSLLFLSWVACRRRRSCLLPRCSSKSPLKSPDNRTSLRFRHMFSLPHHFHPSLSFLHTIII